MVRTDQGEEGLFPPLWAPALPPIALGLVALVLVAAGAMGKNPFWSGNEITLSEAAALRDQGAVLMRLTAGDDVDVRYSVRAGLIDSRTMTITPMEAAVHEDRPEMIALLLSRGARATAADVCVWTQLAARRKSRQADEYLASRYPVERAACAPVETPP